MKTINKSPQLQRLLGEVLEGVEPPARGKNYDVSLRRNREIQRRLRARMEQVTDPEATWPGVTEMLALLKQREGEFIAKAKQVWA